MFNPYSSFKFWKLGTILSNGVALEELPNLVNGKVVLKGSTSKDKIKVIVSKDNIANWYDVNLTNGKYNEEIWLINGKGKYKASVVVHEYDRTYSYGPTIEINNNVDVNRFLVPTKHVESNNEEIIELAKTLPILYNFY